MLLADASVHTRRAIGQLIRSIEVFECRCVVESHFCHRHGRQPLSNLAATAGQKRRQIRQHLSTAQGEHRLQTLRDGHGNVRVERIEASGWPSRPRNVGTDLALGEYVLYMDH
ncbi:MAG TPA: hypothetical protein PLX65_11125, partial [Accumulibacter sp.]|nr:hypothetical protein [Accumulibacter sp.]